MDHYEICKSVQLSPESPLVWQGSFAFAIILGLPQNMQCLLKSKSSLWERRLEHFSTLLFCAAVSFAIRLGSQKSRRQCWWTRCPGFVVIATPFFTCTINSITTLSSQLNRWLAIIKQIIADTAALHDSILYCVLLTVFVFKALCIWSQTSLETACHYKSADACINNVLHYCITFVYYMLYYFLYYIVVKPAVHVLYSFFCLQPFNAPKMSPSMRFRTELINKTFKMAASLDLCKLVRFPLLGFLRIFSISFWGP